MLRGVAHILLLLLLADLATAFIFNTSKEIFENDLMPIKTRRQGRKAKSTSSSRSRRGKADVSGTSGETLAQSVTEDTSSDTDVKKRKKKKDRKPKSSAGRRGWRKWHRKCPQCPEDMRKKWRDPTIKWICGAYQRARRSFKSLCMMHYRNCQDGTMFTKIADHRCPNGSGQVRPYTDHFFYDYKVTFTDDSSTSTASKDDSTSSERASSSWSSDRIRTIPPPPIGYQ